MGKNKNFHITPRDGGRDGWSVRREGADRASSVHGSQADAVDAAREMARREQGELFVHGRDGRIRSRDSYGNDPHPPKG